MLKVKPHADYPTEEGRYLRGNDFSPVAVAIILNRDEDKIPPEIQALVRAGLESGAALSGTIQTPNIGFEKMRESVSSNAVTGYFYYIDGGTPGGTTTFVASFTNGTHSLSRDESYFYPFFPSILNYLPNILTVKILSGATLV